MEQYFSTKVISLLVILSAIIIGVALLLPLPKKDSTKEVTQESKVEDSSEESVSNLFQTEDRKDVEQKQSVPTDIPKNEGCTLHGQVVRGGTVASNTICINESPSVTPKI